MTESVTVETRTGPPTSGVDVCAAATAATAFGCSPAEIAALEDARLLDAHRAVTALRRSADQLAAMVAAEIAVRSTRERGHSGLAQSQGFGTPEAMIQLVGGTSRAEAVKLVSVGTMMSAVDAGPVAPPDGAPGGDGGEAPDDESRGVSWESPIARAVSSGGLSMDAAEAIRRGLGVPDAAVSADNLRRAAEELIRTAPSVTVEQLARDARLSRDWLDRDGVARREKERRDLRYLRVRRRDDGMVSGSFLLDPEEGEFVIATLDAVTAPRRGGPRFVDPVARTRARAIIDDTRSLDQINADTLTGLIRVAVNADPNAFPGNNRPAVRYVVRADVGTVGGAGSDAVAGAETGVSASATAAGNAQAAGAGAEFGIIEGSGEAVSAATIDRQTCDVGRARVSVSAESHVLNLGRDKRLFSAAQRAALALFWGGCAAPGCTKPPAWCEAHHICAWAKDGGNTDLLDGILLCRFHHMLFHNNGWGVIREGTRYWVRPPASVDPERRLIPLHPRRALHGPQGEVAG